MGKREKDHSLNTRLNEPPTKPNIRKCSLAYSSHPYQSLGSNLGTDRSRRNERQGVSFVGRPKSCHSFSPKSSQSNGAAKKRIEDRNTRKDNGTKNHGGRTDRRGTEFYSSKRDGETKVAPADRFLARWFPPPSYSMEINVTAALTKCDALSLSLSVRSHGAQRSLLAADGGE